jgi:hypothetical protein
MFKYKDKAPTRGPCFFANGIIISFSLEGLNSLLLQLGIGLPYRNYLHLSALTPSSSILLPLPLT